MTCWRNAADGLQWADAVGAGEAAGLRACCRLLRSEGWGCEAGGGSLGYAALARVRGIPFLQLASMRSGTPVASVFDNFSTGLTEKTSSVFAWPRSGCDALPLRFFFFL